MRTAALPGVLAVMWLLAQAAHALTPTKAWLLVIDPDSGRVAAWMHVKGESAPLSIVGRDVGGVEYRRTFEGSIGLGGNPCFEAGETRLRSTPRRDRTGRVTEPERCFTVDVRNGRFTPRPFTAWRPEPRWVRLRSFRGRPVRYGGDAGSSKGRYAATSLSDTLQFLSYEAGSTGVLARVDRERRTARRVLPGKYREAGGGPYFWTDPETAAAGPYFLKQEGSRIVARDLDSYRSLWSLRGYLVSGGRGGGGAWLTDDGHLYVLRSLAKNRDGALTRVDAQTGRLLWTCPQARFWIADLEQRPDGCLHVLSIP